MAMASEEQEEDDESWIHSDADDAHRESASLFNHDLTNPVTPSVVHRTWVSDPSQSVENPRNLNENAPAQRSPDPACHDHSGDYVVLDMDGEGAHELVLRGENEKGAAEHEELERYGYLSSGIEKIEDRVYKQGTWSLSESQVLFEAKKREREFLASFKRNSVSADEKWKAVAEYCWSRGVQRSKDQCRFKWENTLPDYRKVRAFEDERPAGTKSYFEMERWERRAWQLPRNMDMSLFILMGCILDGRCSSSGTPGIDKDIDEKRDFSRPPGKCILGGDIADSVGNEDMSDKDGGVESIGNGEEGRERETNGDADLRLRKRQRREGDIAITKKTKGYTEKEYVHEGYVANGGSGIGRKESNSGMMMGFTEDGGFPNLMEGNDCRCGGRNSPHSKTYVDENMDFFSKRKYEGKAEQFQRLVEEKKEARHRERMVIEREKLAAISSVASAMNNLASAFIKITEVFQQR